MSDQYFPGVDTAGYAASAGQIIEDAFGVLLNWMPNRYPLTDRLDKAPSGSPSYLLVTDSYRPRVGTVTNSGSAVGSGATTIPVGDSSSYDIGDVVEVNVSGTYEALLVLSVASGIPDTITVVRGYAGTTAASIPDASSLFLLGNTRTGAEINISAINRVPTVQEQFNQTIQHAYQVGGSLAASTNYMSGQGTPVQRDKWFAMKSVSDDFESSMYYGRGVKITASQTIRPMMKGLRSLIQTNFTAQPTNYSAYKPTDAIRDLIQAPFNNGGEVNMLLCNTGFLSGLATWGIPQILMEPGETLFGVSIRSFSIPLMPNVEIIPAPLLKQGDFIALSVPEVRIRMPRPLFDKPRGSRGDAVEGDMIQEGSIELDNEPHHAFVSGVSGYAKQA